MLNILFLKYFRKQFVDTCRFMTSNPSRTFNYFYIAADDISKLHKIDYVCCRFATSFAVSVYRAQRYA